MCGLRISSVLSGLNKVTNREAFLEKHRGNNVVALRVLNCECDR